MTHSGSSRRRRRIWRFANAEFDESSWALRVDDAMVPMESKPLEILHELLLRAGEVVSKDELFDTVWSGVAVVDGSLATAISKLRRALNDDAHKIIATVPRIGYRLLSPVEVRSTDLPLAPRFGFVAGQMVAGRGQWVMEKPLGGTGADDVWLCHHAKTGEQRVFKFADTPDRLRALKREAALSRLIRSALDVQSPVPRLMEWNFEASPFFLEYAYSGLDLSQWVEAQGGFDAIAAEKRLSIAAQLARAVAKVHALGILHKDLKPANVLVDADGVLRLADFGSGHLLDGHALDSFAITDPGLREADVMQEASSGGTFAYRAPELMGSAPPTVRSDIYAVGLILYQLVVGDFGATLAPGWADQVHDPLIRDDIRGAAALNPDHRLGSAHILADRLETLNERRAEQAAAVAQQAKINAAIKAEQQRLARRPWVRVAFASLLLGLLGSGSFALYAVQQRNDARDAQYISEASIRFLAEDLLASIDPARADAAEESLVQAVTRSGGTIADRFANQPAVAAYLYGMLARAFDLRTDYSTAFMYYAAADAAYERAGLSSSAAAVRTRLQHIGALALSTKAGSMEDAQRRLAKEQRVISAHGLTDGETTVWLNHANGLIALAREDVRGAQKHFASAHDGAQRLPQVFSKRQILNFGQRSAFALIRMGEGEAAEKAFAPLVAEMTTLVGPEHPDTLWLRFNLAQAYLVQQNYDAAITALDPLLLLMEKRLGPDHRYTLQLLATRQQALGSVGRYADAARDGERVWAMAAKKDGVTSFAAIAGRTDTGISQCRAGQWAKGAANIRGALTTLRQDLAGRTAMEDALQAALADCLILQGQLDEAEHLLTDIDRGPVSQLVGDKNWGAQVDLALAEIAAGRGDWPLARRFLAEAEPLLTSSRDVFVQSRLKRLKARIASL